MVERGNEERRSPTRPFMLPQTHHLFIDEALKRAGPRAQRFRRELLAGNDDEDVVLVPVFGWRLRAAGLTHTHVPNGRLGELGFPSAKRQCMVFLAKSRHETNAERAAWWVGRTCHLLGDVAVPARANRVWHLEGDPLEAWIETRVDTFRGMEIADTKAIKPDEIIEELACAASKFAADTTRTPWGRAAHRWLGRGKMLDETELAKQARIMVPMAIASTKALLQWAFRP
jgi:hypothetical protein